MDNDTNSKLSFFDQLDPKSALLVGLIGGVLTLGTIGFIVLGAMTLRGNNLVAAPYQPVAANRPSAPTTPDAPPAPTGPVPPLTKDDHVRGDSNAPLTLIEYSDYECPFCQRFHPTMLKVMEQYKGKVKWVYRHYPLSFHQNAQKEAEAAECMAELGGVNGFWKYTDAIFERSQTGGTGFALADLGPLAKELGVNQQKFQTCLDSGKYAGKIKDQTDSGGAAGINGTPGTFIISAKGQATLITGAQPFEQVKAAIDAALAK
ncbi:MAG: hypothetical protein EXS55_04490 [Candidatus Magasanikbacteria bacterium]|nr:hypothetical protein [Candidatus Magasanikbacteria bacterium]